MRKLLSLEQTRETPLMQGPFVSLSRSFRTGARVSDMVAEGGLHPFMQNLIPYVPLRRHEQERMNAYATSCSCLMAFLSGELDQPAPPVCGRCSPCLGRELVPTGWTQSRLQKALEFLSRVEIPIEPRKRWVPGALERQSWSGAIPRARQAEEGRALCHWGDQGWGDLVRLGKRSGRFPDELVTSTVRMIRDRWDPDPAPEWVTWVPSNRHPNLVPDFALRLAQALGLPAWQVLTSKRETQPQKTMQNSF